MWRRFEECNFANGMINLFCFVTLAAAVATTSVADSTYTKDLEEVSVVASKQQKSFKNEALSSTLLSHEMLEQINADAIKSISDVVPNLYIPDYGSRITSSIYVRGIGARMDQPAVGLTVDNIPIINKNAFDFDVADISDVDMLRGPQSVLFGRNTMAGLINVSTLSPMRWQGWRIMAQGARGNDYKLSVGWYHKFNKDFATGITANFSYLGGFFRNQYTGSLLDKEKSGSLRWKSNWRPKSNLYIQNTLSSSMLKQGGYPYASLVSGEISYNDPCSYRRFMLNDGLSVRYQREKYILSSVTSVQWLDDNMTLDQDFLPDPYFILTQKQRDFALTQDLYFKGEELSGKYKWLAGVSGFYKHLNMKAPVTFKELGISSLIEAHRNEANPDYPIKWMTDRFPLNSDFIMPTWGVAAYHESTFTLGAFDISAGIRLDFEESHLRFLSQCSTGYNILHRTETGNFEQYKEIYIDINDEGKLKRRYFNWLPKLSVLWHFPSGEGNLYGSLSKGYKSGGFNTQMFSDVLQQRLMHIMGIGFKYDVDQVVGYKPEYSWNYEVGAHHSLLNGKLSGDVTLFYIDCRDQQLTVFPSGTTTGRLMTNAGKTYSFGGEISLNAIATDWLQFNGSFGYTNARFREYNNGIADYKGKKLPYVPDCTVFLQGLVTKDVKWGALSKVTLDLNLRTTGKIYWNESNTRSQKAYSLLGASIGFEIGEVDLQLWGKNITGTKYDTFYFMSMGNEFVQRGRPWQVGATFRFTLPESGKE